MSATMMPPGQPGILPGQPGQGAQPNPAFAQWMQAYQQQQGVVAENARRTAQFQAACKLIKDDGVRGFRLDIEADSTIAPDEQAEKQSRVEFLQQIVPLIEQIAPIAQGNPEMAELASEIAMFAVRGFRVARTLEEAFEKAFKVLGQMPPKVEKGATTAAPDDPAIEQAKIMVQAHDVQTRAQTAQQDTQARVHTALTTAAAKAQNEQAGIAAKTQTDQAGIEAKARTDQLAIIQKAQQVVMQTQLAREKMAMDAERDRQKADLDREKIAASERTARARAASSSAGRM